MGYSGNGGPATRAMLAHPQEVYTDNSGNMYISDWGNSCLRIVSPGGIINTIAGIGIYGYSGDGGPATAAELSGPMGIYMDASKNIYVADLGNQRIRKIDASGNINTIAGCGAYGFSGDGGPALAAEFEDPAGICGDESGNIYVADEFNNRVRKIDKTGIITTFAGNGATGYSGDGGLATQAEFYYPSDVAMDNSGNILIADESNNCIRKVNASGIISTMVGNGIGAYSGDGGPASMAQIYNAPSVTVDNAGNIYIADGFNNRVRKINTAGTISTIAGNGTVGYSGLGDTATLAAIHDPVSISTDMSGNVFFASELGNVVEELSLFPDAIKPAAGITIYPNPNNGMFTIKIQNYNAGLQLEVYNVLGQRVSYIGLTGEETQINLSTASRGVYFYKVISTENVEFGSGKIIVF